MLFDRFRRRMVAERVLRGLLYGLAAGLFVCAVLVMAFMLSDLEDWYYFLISGIVGLVVWALVFTGYYLSNRVTEKKVASRVDSTYSLREKASTMVAYQDKDSLLIEKQREDATASVKAQNPKRIPVKLAALNLPLLVLGIACLTTASFTDQIQASFRVEQVEIPDNFDPITDIIINDIEDYIGKAQAAQAFKEKLYQILEQLRVDLKGDTDIASRQAKVDAAKALVDQALDEVNTKEELGDALAGTEDFSDLAEALKNGDVEAIQVALEEMANEASGVVSTNGLVTLYKRWVREIQEALEKSGIPVSDANYSTLSDLAAKLEAIYENVDDKAGAKGITQAMISQLIRDSRSQAQQAIEQASSQLGTDVTIENANTILAEQVKDLMDQLVDPEGYTSPEESEPSEDNEGGQEGDAGDSGDQAQDDQGDADPGEADGGEGDGDGDKGEGSGEGEGGQDDSPGQGNGEGEGAGAGEGETQYGSTDKVYTGENGQTEYGDVLPDYQGQASDDARNSGDEDLEGAIADFWNELYGQD